MVVVLHRWAKIGKVKFIGVEMTGSVSRYAISTVFWPSTPRAMIKF